MIFDIKRYAIHDGPGIRTTVFLKGCPLNCLWCHNPEGKVKEQEFLWQKEKCIECRDCENSCAKDAITFADNSLILDRTKCDLCGACVDACHSEALRLIGRHVTVTQLMKEIEKDMIFYDESGGGVTFSGGEPLMQPSFLSALLKSCKELGIDTAVDTCGYVRSDVLLTISKYVDAFLYDLKVIDDEKHLKFTGVSNKLILENLKELSDSGRRIIVRFPVVPNVNDEEKDILELGEFVCSLENVRELSILPYHKGGVEKARRLSRRGGLPFVSDSPSGKKLFEIEDKLKGFGLKVQIGG